MPLPENVTICLASRLRVTIDSMPQSSPPSNRQPTSCEIVGIGVSVWDSIMLVDSMPTRGSVVQAQRCVDGIGGGISVAIATAARLGSTTAMVDSLGDDAGSNQIIEALEREGVDTVKVTQHAGHSTSTASIWSESSSAERTIVFSPGTACGLLRWNSQLERLVRGAKIVHLNGRHPEICLSAINVAKESDVLISFDGGAYRYRPAILPMLRAADIVIVARQFAAAYFRTRHEGAPMIRPSELAEFLRSDLDCEIAGVTDGAGGSFLIQSGSDCFHQPAMNVHQATDTTGCGDTYHGAFLHALARGKSIAECAELAAVISSANAAEVGGLAFTLPTHDHI